MNQLTVLLGILASSAPRQAELLPALPENQGAPDFHTQFERNPLLVVVLAFNAYFHARDDESWDEYLARLGLPDDYAPLQTALAELSYVLGTLRPAEGGWWTRLALKRQPAWRLVRRLAASALLENGWSGEICHGDAASLVQAYAVRLRDDWRECGRPW